ncbi:MAG: lytic transglycosylase domain-containing protein [Oscillatoriales cyanobacterium]|nr:MAG: lytic transglycosylase domain-containing protein [Oscillatoriales cyanobacterium]TAF33562.1 MAG: lytic transglycosylase domain-containing protein [Oscillatoriales cyanobacterium]TAF58838.1 MAG: lytic transglycosylase domain-containing protein [Oscillatoriales cyanobacterium]
MQDQGGGVFRQEFERAIMIWNGQQVTVYETKGRSVSPTSPSPNPQPVNNINQSVIGALRTAIFGQESGYNYKAVNPNSGALGIAQVMPANIPSWSREALGYQITPNQFLNSPDLQLKIIDYKLNQYYQQAIAASGGNLDIAVRRVASAWYSGNPNKYNSTTPEYTNGVQYPSIANYTLSVLAKFQQAYGGGSSNNSNNSGGNIGPIGDVGIGVKPIKEEPTNVVESGVKPVFQFPWALETPVDIVSYKIWKTYSVPVPGGTLWFELTSLTEKIQATVESNKEPEDPQIKLTLDNLRKAYQQRSKVDLALAFETAGKKIEVAGGVTTVGVTLLNDGKLKKIDLKLEPLNNEFTIEIEQSLSEIGDDIKVKGASKSELKGIYGFQPNPKAEQPQTAPQTTEDLPGWMIAAGVTMVGGAIVLEKVLEKVLLGPIQAYAMIMGIAISIVDPQPKDDPDHWT